MGYFQVDGQILVWQEGQQKVWIQAWGQDGLRVQANLAGRPLELPQALLPVEPAAPVVEVQADGGSASIRNGKAQAVISCRGTDSLSERRHRCAAAGRAGPAVLCPS